MPSKREALVDVQARLRKALEHADSLGAVSWRVVNKGPNKPFDETVEFEIQAVPDLEREKIESALMAVGESIALEDGDEGG